MWTRMVMLTVFGLAVLPLAGQTTTAPASGPAAASRPAPDGVVDAGGRDEAASAAPAGAVVGEVTGTNVYVRCGPSGTSAYPCTKIHKPAQVTVLEVKDDWLRILPTTGCYSVVSKQYVQVDASGKTGRITGENVWTRAGGNLCTFGTVTEFWQLHRQLKPGDKVEILGAGGDFYKIVPPAGCCYWISAHLVDLGGKTPAKTAAAGAGSGVGAHSTETAEPGEQTAETPAKAPEATTAPAIDTSTAWGQFRLVEREMQAEYAKPMDQRDLKGLVAKYQAINLGGDAGLKKYVNSRVNFLQAQMKQYAQAQSVLEDARKTKEDQAKLRAQLAAITVKANAPMPTAFAADGVLTPSGLFPGSEVTPKRYVVRDPDTNRITAYVQCTSGAVNLEDYVNKHVGVTGSTQYDRDLSLYIVEAKEVKVLKADAKLPEPPEPTVKPLPKEAPPVDLKAPTDVQPTSQPAPAAAGKTAAPESEPAETDESEPTTKPASHVQPDMGAGPAAPDSLPKLTPATKPASPATKPAANAEELPSTGLKVAGDK